MAKLCPACLKANPATASYCFYDGRHLSLNGQEGPVQVGTLPLPMPFYRSYPHFTIINTYDWRINSFDFH